MVLSFKAVKYFLVQYITWTLTRSWEKNIKTPQNKQTKKWILLETRIWLWYSRKYNLRCTDNVESIILFAHSVFAILGKSEPWNFDLKCLHLKMVVVSCNCLFTSLFHLVSQINFYNAYATSVREEIGRNPKLDSRGREWLNWKTFHVKYDYEWEYNAATMPAHTTYLICLMILWSLFRI